MPVKLECKYCGKIYYRIPSKVKTSKYCSRECHNEDRNKRVKVYCKICGKEREVYNYEKNTRKYCSECSRKLFREKTILRNKQRKGERRFVKTPVKIKCLYCGKIKEFPPSEGFRKYCDVNCMSKAFKGIHKSPGTEFKKGITIGKTNWFKKGILPSSKGKTYEEIHGMKKAEKIRLKLSEIHKGIKYLNRKKLSENDRKKLSIAHLSFDINKYKGLIIGLYEKGHSSTYIANYIKKNYEPNSKMSYSVVITYLSKWKIKIREAKVPRIAFSWEKLCREEIAKAMYKKEVKSITLPNKKRPDFVLNRKRKDYYEIIFDAKWHPFAKSIKKDIENYTPYCDKLEFWCLLGKINVNNSKVNIISAEELIKKLKEISRNDLINKIKLIKGGIDIYNKKQKTLINF